MTSCRFAGRLLTSAAHSTGAPLGSATGPHRRGAQPRLEVQESTQGRLPRTDRGPCVAQCPAHLGGSNNFARLGAWPSSTGSWWTHGRGGLGSQRRAPSPQGENAVSAYGQTCRCAYDRACRLIRRPSRTDHGERDLPVHRPEITKRSIIRKRPACRRPVERQHCCHGQPTRASTARGGPH